MKLLHTSDWHLGKAVYGNHDRYADFQAVLSEIGDVARDTRPDLILHTGDLFDRAQPAAPYLALGVRALLDLAKVAPTVVVRGNHDSEAMLRSFDLLVNELAAAQGSPGRLRFITAATTPANGGPLDLPASGGQRIRLAALPFVHRNRAVEGFDLPEQASVIYADHLRDIQRELGRSLWEGSERDRDVLVFAAHLYVEGALLSWSERPLDVTDDYACYADALPEVAYCALGHIHKPQQISRAGVTARYAGSPLQLDFGEEGETKSVVLIEANPGRPTKTDVIALQSGRRLKIFTGDMNQLAAQADQISDAFVKAIIDVDDPSPGLSAAVQAVIPRATIVDLMPRYPGSEEVAVLGAHSDVEPEPDLTELFGEYLDTHSSIPGRGAVLRQTFAELLAAADYDEPVIDPVARLLQAAIPTQHD
ncbi:exonuclease SbcCD subunit D [Actinoallomurus sp. NBC_01490]|uniref:metallophosphoesterase family protein n=1 Tax=Actinoallomurus sp. NBC_01490 TaxID=2903557 RepID=UPI002E3406D5|nr:exonuclease SbcCD subunit D [Actinoallomurus sp. NBC_01490]